MLKSGRAVSWITGKRQRLGWGPGAAPGAGSPGMPWPGTTRKSGLCGEIFFLPCRMSLERSRGHRLPGTPDKAMFIKTDWG